MNKRNKALLFIIAALVISNGVLLFLYLDKKQPPRNNRDRKNMMAEMLQKEVGFDTLQLASFEKLSAGHMQKTRSLFDSMRTAREALFNQMGRYAAGDSALQPILGNIARQQQQLDLQVYSNLGEIRKLCTPVQLPKFDTLARKVMLRMGGGKRKAPPADRPHD